MIDLSSIGVTIPTTTEPSEPVAQPTVEKPAVDTTDRSVPLQQRIDTEIRDLKLSAGFMSDYELASANYLAEIIKEQLLVGEEAEHFCEMWDCNKWTFPAVWHEVQEEARKQSNGKSFGCSDSVVLGWVRHIVIDTKNEPKPKPTTAPTPKPTVSKPAKPVETPKPKNEQLHINLSDIFGD